MSHCHIVVYMCDNDIPRCGEPQSNDLNEIMYDDDDENDENFCIPKIGHFSYIDTSDLAK